MTGTISDLWRAYHENKAQSEAVSRRMDELSAGQPADLRGRTGAPVDWPEEDRRRYKEYWDSTNIYELEAEQGELQSRRFAIVRDILDAEPGTAADLIVQLRALAPTKTSGASTMT